MWGAWSTTALIALWTLVMAFRIHGVDWLRTRWRQWRCPRCPLCLQKDLPGETVSWREGEKSPPYHLGCITQIREQRHVYHHRAR